VSWRQGVMIAVVFGVIAAGIVWALEDFERRRMAEEWLKFVREHGVTGDDRAS
jgi:predicted outer membrane lipoprotein